MEKRRIRAVAMLFGAEGEGVMSLEAWSIGTEGSCERTVAAAAASVASRTRVQLIRGGGVDGWRERGQTEGL